MTGILGLPPGLRGFVLADEMNQRRDANAVQQAVGIARLQGMLQELAQNDEAKRREAQMRADLEALGPNPDPRMVAQVAAKYATPQQLLAHHSKVAAEAPQRQAGQQLAALLSSGGFTGVPGEAPASPPTHVEMNDASALARFGVHQNPDGTLTQVGPEPTGPVSVNVPNPGLVRGLSVIAEPDKAIPKVLDQLKPSAQKPMANIRAVTGGYVRQLPDGTEEFVRTQQEAAPKQEPLVAIKGEDGRPTFVPRSEAVGKTPASLSGREDDHMTRRLMQFGQAMDKAGFSSAYAVLDEASKFVNADTAKYLTGARAYIPDAMTDKSVKDARQALQRLFNITLKDRSGAAVTIPEFERLKKEFGTGLWNTPDQVLEGLRQARSVLDRHFAGVSAGFPKEVRDAYFEQLGGSFGGQPDPAQSTPVAPAAPQKKVIRTGTFNGRKVIQYSDGSTEYAQ